MASIMKKIRDHDIDLSSYKDSKFNDSRDRYEDKLKKSCTLYIGNLSFYTTEEQIYALFNRAGEVKRVIMGLNKSNFTPCGFCFVEYHVREHARNAIRYISGTRLDDRIIRCDWDAGFEHGRQFGRGSSGGQMRDEYRTVYDEGRGGFGSSMSSKVTGIIAPGDPM